MRDSKPVVLVLLSHYLPGYKSGGPVRSISNMVEALGDELDFRIVTSDRDLGEGEPYPGMQRGQWQQVGNAHVRYVASSWRGIWELIRILLRTPADLLYLNSFFCRRFSMLAMLLRWLHIFRIPAVLLAPRGEFSQGALRIKSWRKKLYITVARALGFYSNILWHASSGFEESDIHVAFCPSETIAVARPIVGKSAAARKLKIVTALDMPGSAGTRTALTKLAKPPGQIRILFLSRISRKKNLDGALRMLGGLAGRVQMNIYGPIEDEAHWNSCREAIGRLPANVVVKYCGEAQHNGVEQVLADHDALLFPTHGENYGHVIREALSAGCPVIISDQTPWRGLEPLGIGWDLPLGDLARFESVLQKCVDMPPGEFAEWSRRACEYAYMLSRDPEIIRQNRDLFSRALSRDPFPVNAEVGVCL